MNLSRFDVRHLGALPSLASHRLLGMVASNVVGIFFPIFLYEFVGLNLQLFFLWYAFAYGLRIPIFIWAAKIFSRTGLTASLFIGTFTWILFYLGAFFLDSQPGFYPNVVLLASFVFLALTHGFYWSPFHVDFAKFSKKGRRGRELSVLFSIQRVIGVIAPALGGLLIATFSYNSAFAVGIGIIILSLVPLAFLPKTNVQYEFGFFETFQKLFSKKYRFLLLSMMGQGVESVVAFAVWPVFLFTVLDGEILGVGLFSSAIVIVGVVFQLMFGKKVDKMKPGHYLKWGVDIYSFGWFVKALVDTVGGVFAASTFHTFGAIMMRTPLDTMMYQKAADSGHYIDEFTVMREIAITIGRTGLILAMALLTLWLPLATAFVLAALASLAISLFSRFKVGEELTV